MNDYQMLALVMEGKIIGWYHGGTGKFTRNRDDGTQYADGLAPPCLSGVFERYGLSVEQIEFHWVERMIRHRKQDIVLTDDEKRLLGEGRLLWAVKSVRNRLNKDEYSLLDIKRDLEGRPEFIKRPAD